MDAASIPAASGRRQRLLDLATVAMLGLAGWTVYDRFGSRNVANSPPTPAIEERSLIGSKLGVVQARSGPGDSVHGVALAHSPGGTGRLVYLYRSTCPACQRTKETWNRVAQEAGPSTEVTALTADAPTDTLGFFHPPVRTLFVSSPEELRRVIPTSYVPATLLLDRTGVVRYARIGVLTDTDVHELRRAMKQR